MILYRYLMQQFLQSMLSISGVLLLVLLGSQATRLLSRAIAEQQSAEGVLLLLLFSIPELLIDILPAALMLSGILVVSRLHLQNEIHVMQATGLAQNRVLMVLLALGVITALVIWSLMLFINPWVKQQGNELFDRLQQTLVSNALVPGQFVQLQGQTLYLADSNATGELAQLVLLDEQQVMIAQSAQLLPEYEQGIGMLLQNGQQLQELSSFPAVTLTHFQQLSLSLLPSTTTARDHISYHDLSLIRANWSQHRYQAELHRRLSFPLIAIVIPWLIFPLAYANARSGKQAKLIPAILIFVVYVLFLDSLRRSVFRAEVAIWPGMLWVHLGFLVLSVLIWQAPNWLAKFRKAA